MCWRVPRRRPRSARPTTGRRQGVLATDGRAVRSAAFDWAGPTLNALPQLTETIDRLTKEKSELEASASNMASLYDMLQEERTQLAAANDTLRREKERLSINLNEAVRVRAVPAGANTAAGRPGLGPTIPIMRACDWAVGA